MRSNDYTSLTDDNLPGIRDAISNPCNCEVTVAFLDVRGSTGAKFRKSLTAYNSEYVKVVEVIENSLLGHLETHGIPFADSYTGDGTVVTVDTASGAHHLINAVIATMDAIDALARPRGGSPSGEIDVQMSAAIASGDGYRYLRRGNGIEHISSAHDRASRLCSVASAGALFIDADTRDCATMRHVTSPIGEIMDRRPSEYSGELQSVQLRDVPDPVNYYEIFWGRQLHGVRSATVTEISTAPPAPVPPTSPASFAPAVAKVVRGDVEQFVGKVKLWNNDRGFGFVIDTQTQEEFYFGPTSLIYEDDRQHLRPGAELVFLAGGVPTGNRKRLATTIAVVGQDADGKISYIHPDKPFGFIAVTDDRGRTLKFHMDVPAASGFHRNQEVSFTAATNARGAHAHDVEPLDETAGGDAAA